MNIKNLPISVYRLPGREMAEPCKNCPFKAEQEGRLYITEARMEDIKFSLRLGQPFWCHKSVYSKKTKMEQTPEGFEEAPNYDRHYMLCRGAIEWAESQKAEDK